MRGAAKTTPGGSPQHLRTRSRAGCNPGRRGAATTGYAAINNEFQGSLFADVLLDGTSPGGICRFLGLGDSFENTIISIDFVTTVLDFGLNNQLLGTLAMIENPGVPDSVRQALEDMRTDLGRP